MERKVNFNRANLFVPVPHFSDVVQYNRRLLLKHDKKASELHYKKQVPICELFEEDRKALLLMLPPKPFNVCRYEWLKAVIVNEKVPFLSEKIPHLFLSIYRREIPTDKILALTIQILDSDFYSSCDTGISSTFICSVAASFLGLPRRLVDVILSRSFMR